MHYELLMDSDPPQFIPVSCLIPTVVSFIPSHIPALSVALLYHLQYWGLASILYKDYWKPASRILNTVRIYMRQSPLCHVTLVLSGIHTSKEVGLVVNSKGKLSLYCCLVICCQNSEHIDSALVRYSCPCDTALPRLSIVH
jgi:hypothetical protein